MNASTSFRRAVRLLGAAVLLSLALVRPAAAIFPANQAVDWTDIWYTAPEVGWGVNFVQSDLFIFATFFVHAANLEPDWYTGQMSKNADGTWSGGLYRTTGSYYGAPWKATDTNTTQVGTVTFTPLTATTGTLVYNVGLVNVTKQISRLTLTSIRLGGDYLGGIISVVTNCNDSSQNGTIRAFIDMTATQGANGALSLEFFVQDAGACKFSGNAVQEGLLFKITNASYTCGTSFSGTAQVSQVQATAQGLEGKWTAPVGGGCQEAGYFGVLLK